MSTGNPNTDGTKTEVLDIFNENSICQDLPDFPTQLNWASAGILQNEEIVCGGYDLGSGPSFQSSCHYIKNGTQTPFSLKEGKYRASSVSFQNQILILGGLTLSSLTGTKSVEFINGTESIKKEILPFSWYDGCAVKMDENNIMLLGGQQDDQRSYNTWYFTLDTESWINGPAMNRARESFGCGYLNELESVIAFGGIPSTDTTEVLNGGSFQYTIEMPMLLSSMSVVKIPMETNSLIVSGGFSYINGKSQNSDAILKLSCPTFESCSWEVLNAKLKVARKYHVSFMMNFNCTENTK